MHRTTPPTLPRGHLLALLVAGVCGAGGLALLTRLRRDPARDKLLARAVRMMDRRGIIAVFLNRMVA